jgi:hypothetical protein
VSVDVELVAERVSVSGVPRHVDERAAELVTVAGTVRRVLVSRIRFVRVVPPRIAGASTKSIERLGGW